MRKVELGPAIVEVEGDTVFLNRQSAWTAENVGGFLALLEQLRAEHGHVFSISDLSEGLSVSPDARKRITDWNRTKTLDAVVLVKATIAARAVITLLFRGAQLVSGRNSPFYFASSREEAVAIIARERTRLKMATAGS